MKKFRQITDVVEAFQFTRSMQDGSQPLSNYIVKKDDEFWAKDGPCFQLLEVNDWIVIYEYNIEVYRDEVFRLNFKAVKEK